VSGAALALVLASAAIHALWNSLVADAEDTHATNAVAALIAVAVFAPVAAITWDVDAAAVPYIAVSAAFQLAYFGLLATAYARADLAFVYPIARGAAPVLTLVVAVAALGVAVSGLQAAGVLVVAAGILLVRGVARTAAPAGDLALALAVAGTIAGYTLIDDDGLNHAAALPYFEVVLALSAIPYAAAVAGTRGGGALRAAFGPRTVIAGIGMFAAYGLTLAALELAEAAPVAALRETSVLMAVGAAALLGRERVPPLRLAGAVLVVAGAAAVALG
jgi:drug/metabolite transporter (DMT)-like permease